MTRLDGVVPVIPIPFDEEEAIDEPSLRRAVEFAVSCRLAAVCLPAYGSEFYKLSEGERERVIGVAIEVTRKRVPVIAQANHGSSKIAAGLARRYEQMGADIISFAIPRQFATTEGDVLRFCGRIAGAVSIPVLIQDFNPGGPTIGADFIAKLHHQHPNFRYAKLEEPLIVDKLVAIRDKVGDGVGILEGWGGYYMMEAIPAGIVGIMPGLPIGDLLDRVYKARQAGQNDRAYDLFGALLPFINFTLQNMELFLQIEKRLMVRRGLFTTPVCRSMTMTPSPAVLPYIEFLIEQIVRLGRREKLDHLPGAV